MYQFGLKRPPRSRLSCGNATPGWTSLCSSIDTASLWAAGFRFCLRKYVQRATAKASSLSQKHVTPHLFRHTTGVRLIAAGVDSTVVRDWLGHARLDTTNRYARANLETLRNALEQADPKLRTSKPPRWKREADLLAWLDSL